MARPSDKNQQNAGTDAGLGDISSRLKDLSSRLDAEKSLQAKVEKPSTTYAGAQDYSKGYRLASEFVGAILVGALIGYGLDRVFNTLPLFMIVFLLAGFGAGILNMARATNRVAPASARLNDAMPVKAADEEKDK